MKTLKDPFDELLNRWNVPSEPTVVPDVWRRIAAQENTRLLSSVESWFSNVAFAAAFVCCCLLVGLYTAELRLSRRQKEHSQRVARNYVRLIDPVLPGASSKP